jgi:hypothetical protein
MAVRRLLAIVLGVYGAACMAALFFIVASTVGWFGLEPADSTLLPAFALALPWSLVTVPALNTSVLMVLVVLALCMGLNAGVVLMLAAMIRSARAKA